jgi:hypothetical protein
MDTSTWTIVAHDNLEIFVIDLGDRFGARVLDLEERILSAPLPLREVLSSGSFREVPPYAFDPKLLGRVDVLEEPADSSARYEEQRAAALRERQPGSLAGQVIIKPGFDEIPPGFEALSE